MNTKPCKKCGQEKQLSEFYKNPRYSSGYEAKCKECVKEATRRREIENPEGVLKSRLSAYGKKPTHTNAYRVVEAALRAGVIEKPHNCTVCNCPDTERRIEAHHFDYSKPLDVTWLCSYCHDKADQIKRDREGKQKTSRARAVVMLKDGKCVSRFDSIADAARSVGRKPSSISQCLSGKSNTCAGCGWKYEGEDDGR